MRSFIFNPDDSPLGAYCREHGILHQWGHPAYERFGLTWVLASTAPRRYALTHPQGDDRANEILRMSLAPELAAKQEERGRLRDDALVEGPIVPRFKGTSMLEQLKDVARRAYLKRLRAKERKKP